MRGWGFSIIFWK